MSSRPKPPAYCGALPPVGRSTATCTHLSPNHRVAHVNLDGTMWTAEHAVTADSDGRCVCSCGERSSRKGTVTLRREWMRGHLADHAAQARP